MGPYRYGQIVIVARMLDPNGFNPKDRPAVVVTPSADIVPGKPLVVSAISTLLPGPVPADHVPLPWHPQRHPRTGLRTNCAAVCTWLEKVDDARILGVIGIVPGPRLEQIAAKLLALEPPPRSRPS